MRLRLRVVAHAERQIREAALWWRENRQSAPGMFQQELTRGFELITTQPYVGPRAPDADLPDVRRLHLSRIHYHLYYRVEGRDVIEVLALWHTSRGQGPRV
ncbi:MAG TPA: type II toxin-antitoxin system RelE/ParE family toxin [Thermoanaerobaculia bacterium]|nr:type II toxin-antitoxin system RelE/ParE family toxin [Thermoanaerobaculia bacterium]